MTNTRVFVQVWTEIDPTLNLRIDRQTGQPAVEEGDVLRRVSPLGRQGIAEALKLPGAEVTAFAVGPEHDDALRHALAAGASRAFRLPAQTETAEASADNVAAWLAAEKPDLVVSDRSAGRLASGLAWAHLAGLDQLRIEVGTLLARRAFGRGAFEKVAAVLPAIVRLQPGASSAPYVSRTRIEQAGAQAIHDLSAATTTATGSTLEAGPLQLARPRTRLAQAAVAAPAKAADRLNALMGLGGRAATAAPAPKPTAETAKTPDELAQEFIRYLRHHQLAPK